MGAGKTTFVRGAARALGFDGPVTSPTFTIGRRYEPDARGRRHRSPTSTCTGSAGLDDEDPALLDDYLTPDAIAFVEWPEIAEDSEILPIVKARVTLEHAGGDARRITVSRT